MAVRDRVEHGWARWVAAQTMAAKAEEAAKAETAPERAGVAAGRREVAQGVSRPFARATAGNRIR